MNPAQVLAEWRRKGEKEGEMGMPGLLSTTASMGALRSGVYEEVSTGVVAEVYTFTETELNA